MQPAVARDGSPTLEADDLRAFIMGAPAALCILRGPEHRFEIVNPTYVQLVGGRDTVGMTVREALPEVEGQGFFELLDQVYGTGEPYYGREVAVQFAGADGALRTGHFNFTYQPMRDPGGAVGGIAVYAAEVTEFVKARETLSAALQREQELRAAAEESESKFKALFDAMPQLGWFARPDGYIEFYNRGWYDYTGTTPAQMEGWGWRSVHDQELLPAIEARWRHSIETGTAFELTFPLRRHDGVFRWFLTRINPQHDDQGRIIRWIGINTDVDDQRRNEEQLALLLQSEQHARTEAERIIRFSELFVGILGHDLRNPLSAILTGARLLLRRSEDERISKPVSRIVSSSERMTRMIDQLLDFTRARIGGGLPLTPAPTHLALLARRIAEELEEGSTAPRITIAAKGDDAGSWDPDRMAQVVSNLAGNALQHGGGGTVTVTVDGTASDTVSLTVTSVSRVPEEALPTLFDPFRRGAAATQANARGLGLGLYITEQIVTGHGGSIRVDASPGSGTSFIVELPRAHAVTSSGTSDRPR